MSNDAGLELLNPDKAKQILAEVCELYNVLQVPIRIVRTGEPPHEFDDEKAVWYKKLLASRIELMGKQLVTAFYCFAFASSSMLGSHCIGFVLA